MVVTNISANTITRAYLAKGGAAGSDGADGNGGGGKILRPGRSSGVLKLVTLLDNTQFWSDVTNNRVSYVLSVAEKAKVVALRASW